MLSELFKSWGARKQKDPKQDLVIQFKSHTHSDTLPPALSTSQQFHNLPQIASPSGNQGLITGPVTDISCPNNNNYWVLNCLFV